MNIQRWMRGVPLVVMSVMAWLVAGCTTQALPRISEEKPPSDKALIIVERSYSLGGALASNEVYDNDTFVGKIGQGGKLAWLRDPGQMDLQFFADDVHCEKITETWRGTTSTIYITTLLASLISGKRSPVVAGETYRYKVGYCLYTFSYDVYGPGVSFNHDNKYQPPTRPAHKN